MGDLALGERDKALKTDNATAGGQSGMSQTPGAGGDAAQGQSGEVAAGAEAEKKRAAANQAQWEAILGKALGDKLFDLLKENVSAAQLTKYAEQGTKALADQLGSLGDKAFKDDKSQAAALDGFMKALSPKLKEMADEWLKGPSGQKLFGAVSEWVQEHPKTVVASLAVAAIGAAVGAYLANMDPPALEKMFKLGKGFSAGGKIDIGPIQKLAIQAASATVAYEAKGLSASITAAMENKDGHKTTSLEGKVKGDLGANTTANASGKISDTDGKTTTSVDAGIESKLGKDTKVQGTGHLVKNPDGTAQVKLDAGLDTKLGGKDVSVSGGVSQTRGGANGTSTDVTGKVKLGDDKNNMTADGTWNPQTRAFNLNFGSTSEDGRMTATQSFGRDAQGQRSDKTSLDYKVDDNQSFGFSESNGPNGKSDTIKYQNSKIGNSGLGVHGEATTGQNAGYSLGGTYDKDKFKGALDLSMQSGVSNLSGSAQYNDGKGTTAGMDFRANLTAGRFDHFGMQYGWKDPTEFRSFMLKYSADWDEKNPGYKHQFDMMGETVLAGVETRFTGKAGFDGAGNTNFDANVMGAKKLNTDWRALGGVGYKGGEQNGQYKGGMYLQAGVQYKDVPITVTFDPGEKKVMLGITIPFGR